MSRGLLASRLCGRAHGVSKVVNLSARMSNKITGANAGGPRQLPMRTRWAARVAQFCRYGLGLAGKMMGATMPKQLTVIAGPNGSGKTTLAQEYLSQHEAVYLGADAIAEELSPGSRIGPDVSGASLSDWARRRLAS